MSATISPRSWRSSTRLEINGTTLRAASARSRMVTSSSRYRSCLWSSCGNNGFDPLSQGVDVFEPGIPARVTVQDTKLTTYPQEPRRPGIRHGHQTHLGTLVGITPEQRECCQGRRGQHPRPQTGRG